MPQWFPGGIDLSLILAIWGAGLSTLLGAVKLWETWQARFRIEVGASLTGSVELGHTISVRNLSDRQVILSHWEVVVLNGRWLGRGETCLVSADEYTRDVLIPANSNTQLEFRDFDSFSWGTGKRLYIRLWFAGRRPVRYRIGS